MPPNAPQLSPKNTNKGKLQKRKSKGSSIDPKSWKPKVKCECSVENDRPQNITILEDILEEETPRSQTKDKEAVGKGKSPGNVDGLPIIPCPQRYNKFCKR